MERLKIIRKVYSCFSICLALLGGAIFIRPDLSTALFFRLYGLVFLLFGIVKLFGYFSRDLLQLAFQFDFAMGIISALIGFVLLSGFIKSDIGVYIGIGLFMLTDALLRIQTAMDARRIGVKSWWLILVISLITAVIAAILFLSPFVKADALNLLIGLNLIIDGILNLYVVQSTVTRIRRIRKWED